MLLLTYDEFKENQGRTVERVFRFLGIDSSFVPEAFGRYNVSGTPRSKALHAMFVRPSVAKTIAKWALPGWESVTGCMIRNALQYRAAPRHCSQPDPDRAS